MGSSCTALTQIDPICLSSSLSVVEGCSALAKHRIQSAPVYDADAQGFIGILDFRDLVAYVLQVFHKVPKEPVSIDTTADIKDIVKLALGAGNHGVSVKAIANLSGLNPLVSVNSSSPISEAIQQLCKSGVHRVIVIHHGSTGSNDFVGVLSQSTICAFIASRLGPIGHRNFDFWPNARKSLVDLGLVRGGIISITSAETVLDALAVMHKNRISSVAIVDHENGYNQLMYISLILVARFQ